MKSPKCLQMGGRFSVLLPPAFSMSIPAALLLCLLPAQARAATNTVTTLADSGSGSLRQAIINSAPGDTIAFAVTSGTLVVSQALVIDRNLSILGPGSTNLTISGNHSNQIFLVGSGISAVISGFTLRDGQSANGINGTWVSPVLTAGTPGAPGGAISTAGTLTMSDCVLQSNAAGRGGNGAPGSYDLSTDTGSRGANGGAGGAIYNTGALTLSNCLLYANASGAGGASGIEFDFSEPSSLSDLGVFG
jgi:hypothetical protein